MSDGAINDLRGSVEQHSQNYSLHQSFHISPTHTALVDLQRISQATRRRYGAEGNTGKHGTSDLDLSRLACCLALRWQWQLILQPVLDFCDFFSDKENLQTLDFTLPDAEQVIFSPMSAHSLLGVSSLQEMGVHFLRRKPRWVPCTRQAPSELRVGGLGCCVQDAVDHGGAAVGRHLCCAPCAGTTRAGGMCSLLSSHVHIFFLSWVIASTSPLASSIVQKGPNADHTSAPVVNPS